jgi:hypothetical protein
MIGKLLGRLSPDANVATRTTALMARLSSVACLTLSACTWNLWIPQSLFPRIPFIPAVGELPRWIEWSGLALAVVGLLVVALGPSAGRVRNVGLCLFATTIAFLILVDQHRLQPWAYQFLIVAIVLACCPPQRAACLLRLLVISIYLHSALSKCDASFLHTQGQTFLSTLLGQLGISTDYWSQAARYLGASLFPGGELLIALGLCFRRTRFAALCIAVCMHLLLLATLGPWGLGHKPGVLVWNLYFIAQDVLLFGWFPFTWRNTFSSTDDEPDRVEECRDTRRPAESNRSLASAFAGGMTLAVVVLPFFEPFGWYDSWPSWAVYATRAERVRVFVDEASADQLPAELHPFLSSPRYLDNRRRIKIDQWSLHTLDAPVYPQSRFQLGVALALGENAELGNAIHVEIESAANRWTGVRAARTISGVSAIRDELDRFWLNTEAAD